MKKNKYVSFQSITETRPANPKKNKWEITDFIEELNLQDPEKNRWITIDLELDPQKNRTITLKKYTKIKRTIDIYGNEQITPLQLKNTVKRKIEESEIQGIKEKDLKQFYANLLNALLIKLG